MKVLSEKIRKVEKALGVRADYVVIVKEVAKEKLKFHIEAVSEEDAENIVLLKLNSRQRKYVRKSPMHLIIARKI